MCIKQTNNKMKWQSEIAYLPKFTNMIMLTQHTEFEDDIYILPQLWQKKLLPVYKGI